MTPTSTPDLSALRTAAHQAGSALAHTIGVLGYPARVCTVDKAFAVEQSSYLAITAVRRVRALALKDAGNEQLAYASILARNASQHLTWALHHQRPLEADKARKNLDLAWGDLQRAIATLKTT